MSTRPEQFLIKIREERVNLHVRQMTNINDLFTAGEITAEERDKMLRDLQREWQ